MATTEGFLNQEQLLKVGSDVSDTLFYVDFEMIPFNKPVVLENIFYDFDSALLKEESKEELDALIDILNEYPSIIIELKAHTDRWGSEDYNNKLSLNRANSVKDYFIGRGIKK